MRRTLALALAMLGSNRSSSGRLYDALGCNNRWSLESNYFNLGLWRHAGTIDQACAELATALGAAADLQSGHVVLDAGCGFADQDFLWDRQYQHLRIVALNLSRAQASQAHHRVIRDGRQAAISVCVADAAILPFGPAAFDRCLALESAFHFRTRRDFFREAHRVLRPGGRIALADFALRHQSRPLSLDRVTFATACWFWRIPRANLVAPADYAQELRAAGFEDVAVELITGDVIPPFTHFLTNALKREPLRSRYHPVVKLIGQLQLAGGFLDQLDYVIASGRRP